MSARDDIIAGLHLRLLAMLYDALVLLGMWVLTIVLLVGATGAAVAGVWVQLLLLLEAYAFFLFFWTRRGQTLGMLAWRLRVTDGNAPIGLRQAHLSRPGPPLDAVRPPGPDLARHALGQQHRTRRREAVT